MTRVKGRMTWGRFESTAGEKSRTAKLTDDDVREMRSIVFPVGREERAKAMEKAAKKYGISVAHMRSILRRSRWRHLD